MAAALLRPLAPLASRAPVLVLPGERVLCPRLHQLPDNIVELPHGLRQCRERVQRDLSKAAGVSAYVACAAWLWVFDHGDGTRTVVPLYEDQAKYIRAHVTMTVVQVRDFLGMRWSA